MTQAITKRESLTMQTAQELKISDSYLELIKNVFCKGATDDELALFLRTANRTGLDPAARQIFAVKRYDGNTKGMVMSIQISIDGFRLIADRSGKYAPSREPSYTYDKTGNLESATAYIKKHVGGVWHEISATAFYVEYVQKTKEGKPNAMWAKMPRLMLAKCAESLVLRRAFPAELSGLYTADEMGGEHAENNLTNEIKRAEYEADHNEKGLPVEKSERDLLIEQVTEICKELNAAKDSINWTNAKLKEFVNTFFEVTDGLDSCGNESLGQLITELQKRLENLKTPVVVEADEVIQGEVI